MAPWRGCVLVLQLVASVLALSLDPSTSPVAMDSTSSHTNGSSPCKYSRDETYGGVLMDCSDRGISNFLSEWIHPNTTAIDLASNNLGELPANCFSPAPVLKQLDLTSNNFAFLRREWFHGIPLLSVLMLEMNRINLDEKSFREEMFTHLPSLRVLLLGHNGNNLWRQGKYPSFLLKGLSGLERLSLDTFIDDLNFGSIFDNSTSLTYLILTGGVTSIRNSSFDALIGTPVERLEFRDLKALIILEADAYSPLTSLKHLQMFNTRLSIRATLQGLYPFVGRNLTTLTLIRIGSLSNEAATYYGGNKVIDRSSTEYLRGVCLENFMFIRSYLSYITQDALISRTLSRCLKSLDMRDNLVRSSILGLFLLFGESSSLVSIHFSNYNTLTMPTIPSCPRVSQLPNQDPRVPGMYCERSNTSSVRPGHALTITRAKKNPPLFTQWLQSNGRRRDRSNSTPKIVPMTLQHYPISDTLHIKLSRSFRTIYIAAMSTYLIVLSKKFIFTPNRLQELYLPDNGIKRFTGQIIGLDHLQLLDLSRNDGRVMGLALFDRLPSLRILLMQEMRLDPRFVAAWSSRLFGNLTNLEILDVSNNGLNRLSQHTFISSKIRVLVLANNRFESIPVSLKNVPHLCKLDLSFNSISTLTRSDMVWLDEHARRGNSVSVQLEGNVLACTCSCFPFLLWLQTTPVQLDMEGNYSCITDSGQMSNTFAFRDMAAFWRKCNGKTAFLTSLILLCSTCLAFSVAILVLHFRTRLRVYIHQVIMRRVKVESPNDYPIGVHIGYADRDVDFACGPLRLLVEREAMLTSYVRHRDSLANDFCDAAISTAVSQSWRILLVVTAQFLSVEEQWCFYTMKVASSSVRASNLGRLVLLVERGLENKVPLCVLQVVKQEQVIYVDEMSEDALLCRDVKGQLTRALLECV